MTSCLLRIDHDGCASHGWQARVSLGHHKYASRFYADRKWGGRRFARRKAERWLKEHR